MDHHFKLIAGGFGVWGVGVELGGCLPTGCSVAVLAGWPFVWHGRRHGAVVNFRREKNAHVSFCFVVVVVVVIFEGELGGGELTWPLPVASDGATWPAMGRSLTAQIGRLWFRIDQGLVVGAMGLERIPVGRCGSAGQRFAFRWGKGNDGSRLQRRRTQQINERHLLEMMKWWNDEQRCTNRRPAKTDDEDDQLAFFYEIALTLAECCRAATDVRFQCRRRNGATTDRSEQSTNSFTFVNISCITHSLHLELSPTCRLKRPLFNESTATATTKCQRDEVGEMKLQPTDSLHVATFRSINTKTDESVRQLPHWPDFPRQIGRWDQSNTFTSSLENGVNFVQLAAKCDESVGGCSRSSTPSTELTRHFTPFPSLVTTLPNSIISSNS